MANVFGQDLPEELIPVLRVRATENGTTPQEEAKIEALERAGAEPAKLDYVIEETIAINEELAKKLRD